ncbi:cytochrome c [Vibrio sp. S11_S32]|uniref:c-type cytochrome n=1 Tax=Vibrio sp. S11_S32 TaxID=2720225 RepID=UPI001680F8D7|nr:cytochrome c [Vibrio sp. S11_S32]MBD1575611.1 cytochrome c [Vibrio sp. S11_S32]
MKNLSLVILAALISTPVFAADIAAGKAKTTVCASCHGADGIATIPTYPNIKGQNAAYLAKQLKAFKSGARVDPVMKPMASMLTDEDIENVAAYYQSLK